MSEKQIIEVSVKVLKKKNLLGKIITATATMTTLSIAITTVSPVYGASLQYIPTGLQLDNDPINDITTRVGDNLGFTLQLDTTGLSAPLTFFKYVTLRDGNELELVGSTRTSEAISLLPNFPPQIRTTNPVTGEVTTITQEGGSSGVPVNTILDLRNILYIVQPGLTNDGTSDLRLAQMISAIDANGNDVTAMFQSSQGVDVQGTPEPSSLVGLLAFCALGVGSLRKQK